MEESEKRKAIELLREMRSENKTEDGKSGNQETRLNWMYKGPSDLVDKEEYLLGKAIDKTFEVLNSGGSSEIIGRTGEQSNVPKRVLEKTEITEQVDIAKKILEDPLYAIKQKEMEARKKLLNNPVKLKQIKQMLLERSRQSDLHKHKKKKLKKKSEQDLNLLILKKLKKFTDKEKRKALNKIMKSDSSSSESSSSQDKEFKKRKSKRKRSLSSSEDSSDSSSSNESGRKKSHKKKHSESSSSDSDEKKKFRTKKSNKKRSGSSESENSSDDKSKTKSRSEDRKKLKDSKDRRRSRSSERNRRRSRSNERDKRRNRSNDRDRRGRKNYGLMMPDGSKPDFRKRSSPVHKYEKKVETKTKYVPPTNVKPLSEKEKEQKLKEMMEDAKVRKADREKNLANHRKKQAEEEEPKDYDDDFMRRQMSHLTSQGTMADRIKSNINNIQRSKSSMDSNFMRK